MVVYWQSESSEGTAPIQGFFLRFAHLLSLTSINRVDTRQYAVATAR